MPSPTTAANARRQNARNESGLSPTIKSIIQGIVLIFGTQFLMKQFMGRFSGATTSASTSGDKLNVAAVAEIPPYFSRPKNDNNALPSLIPKKIAPAWPLDSLLDIMIIISPAVSPRPILYSSKENVVMHERGFQLGNYSDNRLIDGSFELPREVQSNGTLWGHFYIGLSGEQLDTSMPDYNPERSFHFAWPMTQYIALKKSRKTKNLLAVTAENDDEVKEEDSSPIIIPHYHPNFTISFIPDTGVVDFQYLNPALRQYYHLESSGARDATGQNGWHYPVLFINTFWQLRNHKIPLNSTVSRLPFHINLNNLANWKFSVLASIDEGVKQASNAAQDTSTAGTGDGSELEMIKQILLDTNPYLLATTVFVTIFHMVFEMLAFKSDISHYRNKKNNVGISVRSILGNVFMQAVILLYLIDNNENTNWMILFSQGMGIFLELWKITTVVDVRLRPSHSLLGYSIVFEDKHELSETEEKTKQYDAVAFKYLYIIAIPLLIAYAVYSVIYETHKSWYSFVITTLVGSVYAYGFLMMIPSLYINYRLKSVAHMPARAMTYKFLNTFIDDLFAFTIKMPTLHRLATLRDDIIFFIYLYQSWKYKVDYTRVNEFGQGGGEEDLGAKVAAKPLDPSLGAVISTGIGNNDYFAEKNMESLGTTSGVPKNNAATKRK